MLDKRAFFCYTYDKNMETILSKIKNNKVLFFLILINGLGVLAGSLLAPIEAVYLSKLTDHKFLVGATFALGTLLIFGFSLLVGRLSHIIRRRKFAIMGLALGMIFPLVYASALSIYQYMFGRSIWAFASVASGVVMSAFFQDLLSKKKNVGEISGMKSSFNSIAGTFGAILGGYLADNFGMVMPFYGVMVIYAISLLIFVSNVYPYVEKLPPPEKREKGSFKEAIKNLYHNPYLFLRVFLEGITQSHWAMEPIVFPILIYSVTGNTLTTGLIFGMMGVVAMFALPLAGRFVDRTSPSHALKVTFTMYGIAFLILYLSNNILLFTLGAIILSLGKSFNGPAFVTIETRGLRKENRVEYLSYFKAYDTLTAAITCILVGILLDYVSPRSVILVFAVYTVLGGLVGFYLFNLKHKKFIHEEVE